MTNPMVLYGPGQCTECGTNLVVMDIESTLLELEDNGSARKETTIIRVVGKCPHCGRKYKMFREGLGYVYDNPCTRLQKWYNYISHCKEVEKDIDALKAPKDNPFFLSKNK